MARHGSGSRDRPQSWRAGWRMAADQHVYRRQEGSGQGSRESGNDELTTTGYGHGIRL
jgi:hypothetical protein